jgi:ABC-2 type transport system ATP-binding protein
MQWPIEAEDIVKNYGTTRALDQVSVRVAHGEIFGFLGPNGAGKTTFIKILLNLSFADAGQVKLLGVESNNVASRQKVGFLPEAPYYYSFLTVEEFLIFNAQLINIPPKRIPQDVEKSIGQLNLAHERKKKLGILSKGIKQKVGIAQALLGSPELLLLDEPTSGLDPIGIKEVRDILLAIKRQGTAVFINSHLLSEIERTCDKIAIINNGNIVATGTKDALSVKEQCLEIVGERFTKPMVAELNAHSIKSVEVQDNKMKIYPVASADALTIHHIIVKHSGVINSLMWTGESLEDIFYRLVKNGDT